MTGERSDPSEEEHQLPASQKVRALYQALSLGRRQYFTGLHGMPFGQQADGYAACRCIHTHTTGLGSYSLWELLLSGYLPASLTAEGMNLILH